jgi:hypothetical protein
VVELATMLARCSREVSRLIAPGVDRFLNISKLEASAPLESNGFRRAYRAPHICRAPRKVLSPPKGVRNYRHALIERAHIFQGSQLGEAFS